MKQRSTRGSAGAAALSLILIVSAAVAVAGEATDRGLAIPTLEGRDPGTAAGPRRGVRTFGKGASRVAAPTGGTVEASGAGAASSGPRAGTTLKISGAAMAGSVNTFAVSPNGTTAVYIADQETLGRFELYGTPVDGSAPPTKISAGLTFGSGDEGVSGFQITPDSAHVVFLADPNLGGGADDLFSVPIDGSAAPVRLNTASQAPVTAFGLTRNGASVVFLGADSVFGGGGVELYAASVGVASSARQISDAGATNAQGNVVFADLSRDSTRAVYAADAVADQVFQWFSVPIAAAGPGTDVQLSAALGSVSLEAIDPVDSSTVVYTGDDTLLGVREVFAVPIGGGTKIKLNPAMAGSGASAIEISPDGARVGYLADQNTDGVTEVYGALIGVAGSGTRLNTPMGGTQLADTLTIGPDSMTVLYEADQDTVGTYELFSAPIDASAGPSTLHGVTAPDNVGFFTDLGTPIIGRRAVYPVLAAAIDVFSVPFDGSGPFVRINDALASGNTVRNAFLPGSATRLMAYGVGSSSNTVTRRVHAVPVRRDLPPEQINTTAATGAVGVLRYEIASNEDYGVYLQDQDTLGKPELYSHTLDSDADTVINSEDNCPFVANTAQGSVVFGQTVLATSKTSFAWSDPTEVRFVRGPLEMMDVLATNGSGTLVAAASYTDGSTPAAGAGFYYLFAPDCPGRSYQTSLGAEPGRDLAGLP